MKKLSKSNLSKWIEHLINRELYGNETKARVVEILRDVYDKILKELKKTNYISTKSEYQRVLKEIEKLLSEYSLAYDEILSEQIIKIPEMESQWLQDFMKELGKDFVIPATLFSTVKFSPIANLTNYSQLIDSSALRIKNIVDTSLRTAYLIKESTQDVATRLENKIEKEVANISADTEVFNTTAFSMTDYLMFRKNNEEVRYTAILDSNTCIACGELDGQIFKMKDAPVLPMHYNCRCALQPIELEEPPTYGEWFEEQSDDIKYQILGKTRYQLYKEQGIKISQFVNNGEVIPLKNLKLDKFL